MIAQLLPGSDKAVEMAASRGYETLMLCVVLLGAVGLIGMIFRWFIQSFDKRAIESVAREESRVKEGVERENRLAERVNKLETFVEQTLLDQVRATTKALNDNTIATGALSDALRAKPCLLEIDRKGHA